MMAITRTRQDWSVGSVVKVGLLKLRVAKGPMAIKDGLPDIYLLKSLDGSRTINSFPMLVWRGCKMEITLAIDKETEFLLRGVAKGILEDEARLSHTEAREVTEADIRKAAETVFSWGLQSWFDSSYQD